MLVILKNGLITLIPVFCFLVIRASFPTKHFESPSNRSDSFVLESLASLVGLSALVSILGHVSRGPTLTYRVLLAFTMLFAVARAIRKQDRNALSKIKRATEKVRRDGRLVVLPFLVATYALSPAYLHLSQAGTTFGIATLFNGDIANYSLVADNLVSSGFANSQHIVNADYGAFARNSSYTTANGLLTFISTVTSQPIYRVLLPSMGLAIMFLYITLRYLFHAFTLQRELVVASVVTFGVLNSMTVHTIAQYYISSIVCTSALALILGSIVRMTTSAPTQKTETSFILTLSLSLAIYSYGHIGLVVVAITPFLSVVISLAFDRTRMVTIPKKLIRKYFARTLVCSSLSLVLSTPALGSAYNLLKAQASVQAGYGLKDLNPIGMFLFPSWLRPVWAAGSLSIAWDIVTWLTLLGFVLLVASGKSSLSSIRILQVLLFGVTGLAALAVLLWNAGTYQTWKLWSLVVPIFVVLLGVVTSNAVFLKREVAGFVCAVLVGIGLGVPWSVWGEGIWNPTTGTVLTKELKTSLERVNKLDLDSLNVNLDPFLETMMAGTVIKGTTVAFNSDSYLGSPLQLSNTCTLTSKERVPQGVSFKSLVSPYVLAFYPSLCK